MLMSVVLVHPGLTSLTRQRRNGGWLVRLQYGEFFDISDFFFISSFGLKYFLIFVWPFCGAIVTGTVYTHRDVSADGTAKSATVAPPSWWMLTWRGCGATNDGVTQPHLTQQVQGRRLSEISAMAWSRGAAPCKVTSK
jgi:hypothetical protein